MPVNIDLSVFVYSSVEEVACLFEKMASPSKSSKGNRKDDGKKQ